MIMRLCVVVLLLSLGGASGSGASSSQDIGRLCKIPNIEEWAEINVIVEGTDRFRKEYGSLNRQLMMYAQLIDSLKPQAFFKLIQSRPMTDSEYPMCREVRYDPANGDYMDPPNFMEVLAKDTNGLGPAPSDLPKNMTTALKELQSLTPPSDRTWDQASNILYCAGLSSDWTDPVGPNELAVNLIITDEIPCVADYYEKCNNCKQWKDDTALSSNFIRPKEQITEYNWMPIRILQLMQRIRKIKTIFLISPNTKDRKLALNYYRSLSTQLGQNPDNTVFYHDKTARELPTKLIRNSIDAICPPNLVWDGDENYDDQPKPKAAQRAITPALFFFTTIYINF